MQSRQGLPRQGRTRLKKLVQQQKSLLLQLRMATVNVAIMTARGRELVEMMTSRRVDVLCAQEAKWKGNKAKPRRGNEC